MQHSSSRKVVLDRFDDVSCSSLDNCRTPNCMHTMHSKYCYNDHGTMPFTCMDNSNMHSRYYHDHCSDMMRDCPQNRYYYSRRYRNNRKVFLERCCKAVCCPMRKESKKRKRSDLPPKDSFIMYNSTQYGMKCNCHGDRIDDFVCIPYDTSNLSLMKNAIEIGDCCCCCPCNIEYCTSFAQTDSFQAKCFAQQTEPIVFKQRCCKCCKGKCRRCFTANPITYDEIREERKCVQDKSNNCNNCNKQKRESSHKSSKRYSAEEKAIERNSHSTRRSNESYKPEILEEEPIQKSNTIRESLEMEDMKLLTSEDGESPHTSLLEEPLYQETVPQYKASEISKKSNRYPCRNSGSRYSYYDTQNKAPPRSYYDTQNNVPARRDCASICRIIEAPASQLNAKNSTIPSNFNQNNIGSKLTLEGVTTKPTKMISNDYSSQKFNSFQAKTSNEILNPQKSYNTEFLDESFILKKQQSTGFKADLTVGVQSVAAATAETSSNTNDVPTKDKSVDVDDILQKLSERRSYMENIPCAERLSKLETQIRSVDLCCSKKQYAPVDRSIAEEYETGFNMKLDYSKQSGLGKYESNWNHSNYNCVDNCRIKKIDKRCSSKKISYAESEIRSTNYEKCPCLEASLTDSITD